MGGYVDLHCHWLAGLDDGARTADEGLAMLQLLAELGFEHVVATPHLRPGMFDGTPAELRHAFAAASLALRDQAALPAVSLGSEHFFHERVLEWIHGGEGLPYRSSAEEGPRRGGAVLIEFADLEPTSIVEAQLFRLQTAGFIPVLAHPERYRAAWREPELVERLVDAGSVALLDLGSLEGKYGQAARRAAEELLDRGVYDAACSDAHRPSDVQIVAGAMTRLARTQGQDEAEFLLGAGPRALLEGRRPMRPAG